MPRWSQCGCEGCSRSGATLPRWLSRAIWTFQAVKEVLASEILEASAFSVASMRVVMLVFYRSASHNQPFLVPCRDPSA